MNNNKLYHNIIISNVWICSYIVSIRKSISSISSIYVNFFLVYRITPKNYPDLMVCNVHDTCALCIYRIFISESKLFANFLVEMKYIEDSNKKKIKWRRTNSFNVQQLASNLIFRFVFALFAHFYCICFSITINIYYSYFVAFSFSFFFFVVIILFFHLTLCLDFVDLNLRICNIFIFLQMYSVFMFTMQQYVFKIRI